MTPKEKAKSLVDRMERSKDMPYQYAKQCALIAVDEILDCTKNGLGLTKYSKEYWFDVKKEILKDRNI